MCMSVLPVCVCGSVCTICVPGAYGGQNVTKSPDIEL